MAEVASAYVSLLPTARGFGQKVDGQIGGELDRAGKSGGSRMSGALGGVLKASALGIGVAAGGILGAALFKGFNRLKAIDQARAKLSGLGHSVKTVDTIMGNALSSVKGTAFGLDEAATTAASAVAAGIKPGRDLTRTLSLVADAATIGGTSMGDMGAIFNKVATSNKVQGDVINQLNDRGIPIVQLLGKSMGKTAEQVLEMSQTGKIGFADFSKAMQAGLGGAALKSGDTFSGALANLNASLGRIGAGFLKGIFPHLAPMFAGITAALAPVEAGAASFGAKLGAVIGPALEKVGPMLAGLIGFISRLDFAAFATKVTSAFTAIGAGDGTMSSLGASFSKIGTAIGSVDFSALGKGLGKGAADTVSVFAVVIGFLADHIDTLVQVLPALVVAFAAYKTAQAAANVVGLAHVPISAAQVVANFALASSNRALASQLALLNGVEKVGLLTRARATIVTIATTVASKAAAVGTKVWAATQWLLNAAMTANPIGLVVLAIVLLIGGLILAYKHSETFRNIVNSAFTVMKTVVLTTLKIVLAVVKAVWGFISGYIRTQVAIIMAVVRGVAAVAGIIGGAFKNAYNSVITWIGNIVSAVKAIPGKVLSALGKLGTLLTGVGKDLIQGLVNGIRNGIGLVTAAVKALADKIPGPIKKILKMTSPSRVFAGFGENIVDGLVVGIDSRKSHAVASIADLAAGLGSFPTAMGVPAFAGAAGGSSAGGVGDIHIWIGDREITDIVRVEVGGAQKATARQLAYGRRI